MRIPAVSLALASAACLILASASRAQHSTRIADASELGAEVILGEDVTSFAGVFQTPIGAATDARAGLGVASPDEGDSDVFLTGGVRSLVSRRSARFPLDIVLDGQLDLFLQDETAFGLAVGPSFGAPVGRAALFFPYIQPLLVYLDNGDDSETDLAVRLGADYALTPTVDLRGDLVLGDATALRAALYFQFGGAGRR